MIFLKYSTFTNISYFAKLKDYGILSPVGKIINLYMSNVYYLFAIGLYKDNSISFEYIETYSFVLIRQLI